MHRHVLALGLSACSVLFLAGCTGDSASGLVGVRGKVKLKGQPIKDGTVSFEPTEGQDTRATAVITDGAYDIPRGTGLKPGKYLIRVSAGDGKTAVNPVDEDSPPGPTGGTNIISKDLVPKDWNVNSRQERTITTDNPNTIDFEIP